MQKLLIASIVGALVLTGCGADTTKAEPVATAEVKHEHGHKKPHHHHHAHMDKKGHGYEGTHPHFYQCVNDKDEKAMLVAHPTTDSDFMKIEVTAPSLSLNNQTIELQIAPSASGERYINDKNPASVYTWHAKAHEGVFSVNVGGTDYDYRCKIGKGKKH